VHPRMDRSLPPLFSELGEYTFQELCCDLFERQEGISTCEIYGVRGQAQYGIDLLAHRKDGLAIEVGQCKCYEEITASEIEDASDEFFSHLERWKQAQVERFILFVACELDKTQQQDQILAEKSRFILEGIQYEAWSSRTLRHKLSPYRYIATRHIWSEEIVDQICGPLIQSSSALQIDGRTAGITIEALGSHLQILATQLSQEKAKRLDDIREKYRNGRYEHAASELDNLHKEETYNLLEPGLKARILRMRATYTLNDKKDMATARKLADEAHELDPQADETVIRTLIAYHEQGADAALELIKQPSNTDVLNFRLLLLLEIGRTDEILETLNAQGNGITEDAETRRVYAWALLIEGDITAAQFQIQKAVSEQPAWHNVKVVSAIMDYFSALSPAAIPKHPILLPDPVDWAFVKRDHESQARLRRAQESFAELSDNAEKRQRSIMRFWHFACLANDVEKQMEAETLCQNILLDDPSSRLTIMWAIARRYRVDLAISRKVLEESLLRS